MEFKNGGNGEKRSVVSTSHPRKKNKLHTIMVFYSCLLLLFNSETATCMIFNANFFYKKNVKLHVHSMWNNMHMSKRSIYAGSSTMCNSALCSTTLCKPPHLVQVP